MTTNLEWLYSMQPDELTAWFDAQHVDANDALSAGNDVSADAVDANDANAMQDSREKILADLEKQVRVWHDYDGNFMRIYDSVAYAQVKELLDRQAAITHREAFMRGRASLDDELAEYADEIAELAAQVDELSQQLINARADCEQYRELLSEAIRYAHEIVNLQP